MSIFFVLPAQADWTFKPVVDLRERIERRIDKDFSESGSDNRADLFSRWRVGVDFTYRRDISGRVVYQYAHNLFWTAAMNASTARSDLHVAYVDVNALGGKARLGRQVLTLSTERLLGPSDWGNTGRTYDMARWTGKNWELFGGKLAVNSSPNKHAAIAGAMHQSRYGDTMLLFKHDQVEASHDDVYTLDHVVKFKKGKWSGDFELAGQLGRTGDRKLEAWATGLKVNYQNDPKWKLYAEVAAASGGQRGNTSLTFDQVYASNHSRYGVMDMQGFRNMTGLSLGANFKPTKQLTVNMEIHKFGLWAADDAWYSDGGRPNSGFKDATGQSGKDVGEEIDLWASYTVDAKSTLEVGTGIFRPGGFIKSFANKGDRSQVWGYFQYRLRF